MIKTFRFCSAGLRSGRRRPTGDRRAGRSASPRLNWLLMLKNARYPRAGRGDPRRRHSRAHRRGDCSAPLQDGQYVTEGDLLLTTTRSPRGAGSGAGRAEKRRSLITSVAAVAHSLRAAYQQSSISRNDVDAARAARRRRRCRAAGQSPRRGPADSAPATL